MRITGANGTPRELEGDFSLRTFQVPATQLIRLTAKIVCAAEVFRVQDDHYRR